MRRSVSLVVVLAVCMPLSASGASSSLSPRAVRASIVTAALAQKSVHWHEVVDGVDNSTTAADVSADSGAERYSFHALGQPGGTARIRLVDDTIYFQGDAVALVAMLDLSQDQATTYAGQWISIPKGDELYPGLADGLTLASAVHHHTPAWGTLRLLRGRTPHGIRLLIVQGKSPGRIWSLSTHAHGKRLPIKFTYEDLDQGVKARFSKWNEPVDIQVPANSTPIATARG